MTRPSQCLLTLLLLTFTVTLTYAQPVVLCTEDPANGCVAQIPTSAPPLFVASDGEAAFDPFGFGADTSDGIQLNSNWKPLNNNGAFNAGFWTQIPGTFTWVLPATIPNCGSENEPTCEPVATWFFPGAKWVPGTPSVLQMLEVNGTISDVIDVNNFGPGGSAEITFISNVPEPASLLLLGSGLLSLVGVARKRMKQA